jgi:hypothetical protein
VIARVYLAYRAGKSLDGGSPIVIEQDMSSGPKARRRLYCLRLFFGRKVSRVIDIHRIVRGRSESEGGAQGTVRHSKTRQIGYWVWRQYSIPASYAVQAPGQLESLVEPATGNLTAQHG